MERAIQRFKSDHGKVDKDAKLFVVIGHYDDLRQEMLKRGWVEHEHTSTGATTGSEKFKSNAFNFLYSTKAKDCFRIGNMAPS